MQTLTSINPANGKLLKTYPVSSEKKVANSIRLAEKTFEEWRKKSFKERATVIKKIATALRKEKTKLATLASLEMGKPFPQSMAEVEKCAVTLDFFATNGAAFLADEIVKTEASKSYVSYQPLGVVLAIMPWNFPYWQVFRAMAPALMAGNVLLLKHASNVSGCALAIEEIMLKAGAPKGLFQTLLLPSSQVESLIAHPAVAAVTFTGSTEAGKKVAGIAGANIKKQVLELGGNDAYIILEDADLDLAATTCVNGRLINSGQSCVAAKRFIAVKSVHTAFVKKVVELMQAATYGDALNGNYAIGPMARTDLREQLHEQVLQSITQGAKLVCGGFIPDGEGAFYPPTVLTHVKKGMPAYHEELFGPVASIIQAKHETDAIRIANDSEYGLGAGIFSKNKKRAEAIAAKELQAGNCFVNAFVHSNPHLPFGGVKQSGYGRELSVFGIREFVNIKTVFIQ